MFRSKSKYWSCSKFADWVRGTPKMRAGTLTEWDNWREKAKGVSAIRYVIAEVWLDAIQDFLLYPQTVYRNIRAYYCNRFVDRTHALTASPSDIKPGQWRDLSDRFLPCMFNELVMYVESELAHHHASWADDKKYTFKKGRCKQAGLDNLHWQSELVWTTDDLDSGDVRIGQPTQQAINAQEIYRLYDWWTRIRPSRPDPGEESGWFEYCASKSPSDIMDRPTADSRAMVLAMHKLEEAQAAEDEEMMIRLIKVRSALWT